MRTKQVGVTLVLLGTILLVLSQSSFTTQLAVASIFKDDFEAGTFSGWTGTQTTGSVLTVTSGEVHSGYYKAVASSLNAPLDFAKIYHSHTPKTTIYMRTYLKFVANVFDGVGKQVVGPAFFEAGTPPGTGIAVTLWNPSTNKWGVQYYKGTAFTEVWQLGTSSVSANIWYSVELKLVVSGTVGEVQLWVGGAEKLHASSLDTDDRGSADNSVCFVYLYNTETSDRIVHFDSVGVSDNYIGPETTEDLTILATEHGHFNLSVGVYEYASDSTVDVTAIADSGWSLDYFVLDTNNVGKGVADTYSVTMSTSHTLGAVFTESVSVDYTLTVLANADGTTSPASGAYTYTEGEVALVTATANTGYSFDYWFVENTVNRNITGNPLSLAMDHNYTVTPTFMLGEKPQYNVTVTIQGQGTTNPSEGSYTFVEGQSLTIVATPSAGWTFANWTITTTSETTTETTLELTYEIRSDTAFTATFVEGGVIPTPTGGYWTNTLFFSGVGLVICGVALVWVGRKKGR